MNVRDAILRGAMSAARLHKKLDIQPKVEAGRCPVDVFGSIVDTKTMILFRPLDGLLGACLTAPARGIIISTNRPLSVQRFTGAHELGHVTMQHQASLDGEEILGVTSALQDVKEVEANAFASEFLAPSWLISFHAMLQGWNRLSLQDPTIVYQLSLRLGISYLAACIALLTHKLIDRGTELQLKSITPKSIKQKLLRGYSPPNYFRDVWVMTARDEGCSFEGQKDDIFVFRLREKSSAGYLWSIEDITKNGFAIAIDNREIPNDNDLIGGHVERIIVAQSQQDNTGELLLSHRRPWQASQPALEDLRLLYDLRGKQQPGYARSFRNQLALAV
jgi:Zn-dependent peptidase ImmA (M78 family)/predicted secreted protein